MKLVDAWRRFWLEPQSLVRLGVFRALVMTLVLCDLLGYSHSLMREATLLESRGAPGHWAPIFALDVLGLGPIGPDVARAVVAVGVVACVGAILGLFSRLSCLVAALASLYVTAVVYSFEKVHHDKATMALTIAILPLAPVGARCSLDALLRAVLRGARGEPLAERAERHELAGFPIRWAQLSLAIGYCAAGLSKLAIGGLEWANGYTLMAFLAEFDRPWTSWINGDVDRVRLFSLGALALQVSFPLLLVWPRLAWIHLPAAAAFHVTNWMTMDTGPYLSLWFMTIAFVPLERVPAWLRERARGAALLRSLPALFVAGAPLAVVAHLWFFEYLPRWALVVWIPLLASAWMYVREAERLVVRFTASCPYSRAAAGALRALDWAGRLRFEALPQGARGLRSFSVSCAAQSERGWRAWVAIARSLPLTAPVAWFARRAPLPS